MTLVLICSACDESVTHLIDKRCIRCHIMQEDQFCVNSAEYVIECLTGHGLASMQDHHEHELAGFERRAESCFAEALAAGEAGFPHVEEREFSRGRFYDAHADAIESEFSFDDTIRRVA